MYARLNGPELLTRALDAGWSSTGDDLPQHTATKELDGAVNAQTTLKLKPQAQVCICIDTCMLLDGQGVAGAGGWCHHCRLKC